MIFSELSLQEKEGYKNQFRFGLESEYLVVDYSTKAPLWHKDLLFEKLNTIFEDVNISDLPTCEGLDLEKPQKKLMPFVVEGYHLPDMDMAAKDLLPKGVEIRTPVCKSLDEVLKVHCVLYERLLKAMNSNNYDLICLSHHPLYSEFSGPQNKRRHDYWQWSMEVMTTYGPDINVSLPSEMANCIDANDLEKKINYYGPALSALSVASPIVDGNLWRLKESIGKSYRMHKRSYIAPPIEFHPDESNRYEFKVFDMPDTLAEIEAQFLLFLGLVLDQVLLGRESKQARIYDLGQVARYGLKAEDMKNRAKEFISHIEPILKQWGYNTVALEIFKSRIETGLTPADEIIQIFEKHGLSACLESRKFKY